MSFGKANHYLITCQRSIRLIDLSFSSFCIGLSAHSIDCHCHFFLRYLTSLHFYIWTGTSPPHFQALFFTLKLMITEIHGVLWKVTSEDMLVGFWYGFNFLILGCWINWDCSALKDVACWIRELESFVDLISFISMSGCACMLKVSPF